MRSAFFNVFLGLLAGLLLAAAAGENPVHVARVIFSSAFGSKYDLGLTLFYMTPLIFTGLAVTIAFHAGLFNIGGEGQLTVAALAAAGTAGLFPHLAIPFAPVLAFTAAMLAGGAWGGIAGWLKAKRGSHEVIVTIMLNFVAYGLANWLITGPWHSRESQNPETSPLSDNFFMRRFDPVAKWFNDAPVSAALLVAILVAIAAWFFLYRTKWGFTLRAAGANETAAKVAGFSVSKVQIFSMALSGVMAGMVVLGQILLSNGKVQLGFSADYGFLGIAVAFLARNNPLGIIPSALLFAVLHKGAGDLDLETDKITRDFALILQAVILLFAASGGLRRKR